jgi:hypothetical protein
VLGWDVNQLLTFIRQANANNSLRTDRSQQLPQTIKITGERFPLSFEQEAIWLDLQLALAETDETAGMQQSTAMQQPTDPYNLCFSMVLKGRVDSKQLLAAVTTLTER